MTTRHDAVLLLSFGGPEHPDDVMPFLRNVTRGRNVPDERLTVVAEQYRRLGGVSPINDQCRALISALRSELERADLDLPVYWGNRNWHPFLAGTVGQMADDGIARALVFATSAFGTYSGCRQYREDLDRARAEVGPRAPELEKLRLFYNHPGFVEPMAANLRSALDRRRSGEADDPAHRVVFCAHSIPETMADTCSYTAQLEEAARLVLDQAAGRTGPSDDPTFDLVFQSRSGPPTIPWLEPDVNDHLRELATRGVEAVTLVPIGFISDHMEVRFDLDTEAAATAEEVGIDLVRVATVGTAPRFVTMIRELIEERVHGRPRLALGPDGPWPDSCPDDHCPAPGGMPAGRPGD